MTLSFRYKNKVKRHKKEIDEIIEIYNRKTKELEYDYNKKTTELNDNYKSKLNDLLKERYLRNAIKNTDAKHFTFKTRSIFYLIRLYLFINRNGAKNEY